MASKQMNDSFNYPVSTGSTRKEGPTPLNETPVNIQHSSGKNDSNAFNASGAPVLRDSHKIFNLRDATTHQVINIPVTPALGRDTGYALGAQYRETEPTSSVLYPQPYNAPTFLRPSPMAHTMSDANFAPPYPSSLYSAPHYIRYRPPMEQRVASSHGTQRDADHLPPQWTQLCSPNADRNVTSSLIQSVAAVQTNFYHMRGPQDTPNTNIYRAFVSGSSTGPQGGCGSHIATHLNNAVGYPSSSQHGAQNGCSFFVPSPCGSHYKASGEGATTIPLGPYPPPSRDRLVQPTKVVSYREENIDVGIQDVFPWFFGLFKACCLFEAPMDTQKRLRPTNMSNAFRMEFVCLECGSVVGGRPLLPNSMSQSKPRHFTTEDHLTEPQSKKFTGYKNWDVCDDSAPKKSSTRTPSPLPTFDAAPPRYFRNVPGQYSVQSFKSKDSSQVDFDTDGEGRILLPAFV